MSRSLMLWTMLCALNLLALGWWLTTTRWRVVLGRGSARRVSPRAARLEADETGSADGTALRAGGTSPADEAEPGASSEARLARDIERWRLERHGPTAAGKATGRIEANGRVPGLESWIEEVERRESDGDRLPRAAGSCRAGAGR